MKSGVVALGILISIAVMIGHTSGLQCYRCSSENCQSFLTGKWQGDMEACNQLGRGYYENATRALCTKESDEPHTSLTYVRACAYDSGETALACGPSTEKYNRHLVCFCDTDGCNGATPIYRGYYSIAIFLARIATLF